MKKPLKMIALVIGIISIAITAGLAQDTPLQEPSKATVVNVSPQPYMVEGPKEPKPVNVTIEEPRKEKEVVQNTVKENTQDVTEAITTQAAITYTYVENQIYKVYCTVQHITDVQLQPGEEVLYIGGGDTAQWIIDQERSGAGENERNHIYIKALKPELKTNLVINTDRHVYHLQLQSGNWYTPIIKWVYPQDERAAFLRKQQEEKKIEEETTGTFTVEAINFKYRIKGRNYSWKTKMVFDDGQKTYIQMPETMSSSEAPALFIKNGKELHLVNYRVKNNYYIVDRIFAQAELRCGKDKVIIINEQLYKGGLQ